MYLGIYMYIHTCMTQQLMTKEPMNLGSRRRIREDLKGEKGRGTLSS